MAFRSVRLDQGAIDRLVRSRGGPVGRELSRIGGFVTREAKQVADERLTRRTGLYASSFSTTTRREGRDLRTRVTNTAPYAVILERGSRAHVIRPRRFGGVLVFQSGGSTVFAQSVNHPGTKGQRVLETALRRGLRRAGV